MRNQKCVKIRNSFNSQYRQCTDMDAIQEKLIYTISNTIIQSIVIAQRGLVILYRVIYRRSPEPLGSRRHPAVGRRARRVPRPELPGTEPLTPEISPRSPGPGEPLVHKRSR